MAAYRSHVRPESVPVLNLGKLAGDIPESNNLEKPLKSKPQYNPPNSSSTVSWGTRLSSPYHTSKQDIMFGGTVHRPCTHIRHKGVKSDYNTQQKATRIEKTTEQIAPSSSAKYHDDRGKFNEEVNQNRERVENEKTKEITNTKVVEKELKSDELKKKGKSKPAYWYDDERVKTPPPKDDHSPTIDDLAHMQADYTGQSYSDVHSARKVAAEDGLANKQKQQVMEQVLVDLLSRHVISDPDQDRDPARSNPADPLRQPAGMAVPPLRLKSRRLHETRVSTAGAVTETSLKSRVTFSARILTRNGRDALRELFGFFFNHDQTITVYEYRNFGKNNFKALPFLERSKYKHQNGRRKGREIKPNDIQLGKNLSFTTHNQSHVPETIKKQSLVTIRICEVDENCSSDSSGWQLSTDDRDLDSDGRLERKDREIVRKLQEFIRGKLRSRSVSVLMGLGQLFRTIDSSGDGFLSKAELSQALQQFDISIPHQDFEAVWRVVDENNDGAIDYGEFMRAFIGEMSEFRKQLVRKVFKKLDPHKTGTVSLLDMKKLYSAKMHPLVTSGKVTQEEMEVRFIDSFTGEAPGCVSYVVFEEYYEGLSIVVTSDTDFRNMMKNCWGV